MLDSYFFVPGDKPKYLNNIKNINSKYFVIDLEESVSINNKFVAFELIKELDIMDNFYVRIPFKDDVYTKEQVVFLTKKFKGNLFLPKVNDSNDIDKIILTVGKGVELNITLLVENPTCIVNLPSILVKYANLIKGIVFGSHDFCATMNMKHNMEHLSFYRKLLIMYAKAYGIDYIDGVDVNIRDLSMFIKECYFAFEAGADGKALIHPNQLSKMNKLEFLSKEEINEAKRVYDIFLKIKEKDVDLFEIDGVIYEKPHIIRIKKILESYSINIK